MRRSAAPPRRARTRRPRLLASLVATALVVPATAATADIERTSGDGLVPVVRYAGENRYDTAQLIATEGPAEAPVFSSDTVVIARGDAFPDGLAGSFLAGQTESPILLTGPERLPADTIAALDELAPARIAVLGGTSAVSSDVLDQLASRPGTTATRVRGDDRYETAAAIAVAGANTGAIGTLGGLRTAFLATGARGADALVAGPIAAAEGFPVFLTRPAALPDVTAETMEDLDIQQVVVVGGEAAIAPSVATAVEGLGITVRRIAGERREETALEIAAFAQDELAWTAQELYLASAADRAFPDSLTIGPRAALSESPVLLVGQSRVSATVRSALADFDATTLLGVAGGTAAISEQTVTAARTGLALQAEGLAFPRSFGVGPDGVYVAEQGAGGEDCVGEGEEEVCFGNTGAVTLIGPDGPERVYDQLPSFSFGGVVDVAIAADGTVGVPMGLGVPADQRDEIAQAVPLASQFGTFGSVDAGGYTSIADLAAFEAIENVDDREETPEGDPPLNSNPFGVARDEARGQWVVADAGGNSLIVIPDATPSEPVALTDFPDAETPEGPRQYVPTSVVVGPDGAYYVGGLGGEFPGAADIYRVDPVTGEATVYEEGFTFVLDIGFGADGTLYVLQAVPTMPDFSGEDPGPGVVVRVPAEGERTELGGGGLEFPLGLEVTADGLYVSHKPFTPSGEVLLLDPAG